MTANERELLPPPQGCKSCWNFEQITNGDNIRSKCKPGHPMHNGCTWHKEKNKSLIGGAQ